MYESEMAHFFYLPFTIFYLKMARELHARDYIMAFSSDVRHLWCIILEAGIQEMRLSFSD
jgi:hypothetical protein